MSLIHSPVSNASKSGKTKLRFFPSRTQGKPIRYFEKKKKREGGRRRHLLWGSDLIFRTINIVLGKPLCIFKPEVTRLSRGFSIRRSRNVKAVVSRYWLADLDGKTQRGRIRKREAAGEKFDFCWGLLAKEEGMGEKRFWQVAKNTGSMGEIFLCS